MISSVLRSDQAIQVNVFIMRAFVRMREMVFGHDDLSLRIDQLEEKYDKHDDIINRVVCPE